MPNSKIDVIVSKLANALTNAGKSNLLQYAKTTEPVVNENTINNWLDLARYDLETASAMLESGRYLYVAFTCQ